METKLIHQINQQIDINNKLIDDIVETISKFEFKTLSNQ